MTLSFGITIKELRVKRGLSQEKLAEQLGVTPQSVSKWERNEGYPDITFLIPLSDFFNVTLDTLMGRNEVQREANIKDILSQIEHYRHIGDHETKNKLIKEAYKEYLYDFRIVSWYIVILADVEDITENQREIEHLCNYILAECTVEEHRYEAIAILIDLYSRLGNYDKANVYVNRLPDMNFSKEFMKCDIYPKDDERKYTDIAYYLNREVENILWLISQIGAYNPTLNNHDRISVLEQACKIADAVYPEFDHCICHSSMADIYLLLFRYYSEESKYEHALESLRKAFIHGKAIDEIYNCVVMQTSSIFMGYEFNMQKTYDGCKCNSVWWLFQRLSEPSYTFEQYHNDIVYQEILDEYRLYAVEDKTMC